VLALSINAAFSAAGIFHSGLANLIVQSGKMRGQTVGQVLSTANLVLGGQTSALPAGMTISDLNDVVDAINNNFDDDDCGRDYVKSGYGGYDWDDWGGWDWGHAALLQDRTVRVFAQDDVIFRAV